MPDGPVAQFVALLQQLNHSQWWSPDQLETQQFRQLALLLEHAFDTIPFYRARLEAAGYRRGQAITREFWSRIPVLSRREVQEQGSAICCATVPAEHGHLISDATSGSTGTPLMISKTDLSVLIWHAITVRHWLWCASDFNLKFAAIRRFSRIRDVLPDGRTFPDWGDPVARIFPTGPAAVLDNRTTPQQQADWLMREEPDILLIYPSVVQELARYFRDRGLRLRRLKGITTMGEALAPGIRAACREAFGIGVTDIYSASETGYLALQCPLNEHYHAQSENLRLEVLDESGQPCLPGEVGTVVVTPLHNFAMPLLRYALGDLARVGGACSCGRGLPVLTEILGRTRDTVMLPSGSRRYAWTGLRRLGEMREIVQFQVVQRTLYDLEVKLVVRNVLGRDDEEKIRQTLRDALGAHFSVMVTYHDAIPRASSGKYFEFISEVPG